MKRFVLHPTPIAGLQVLERKPLGDARGYFERMFCDDELAGLLGGRRVAQINHSLTDARGTVRGMHFQYPPHAETKLVSCLRGAVYDVAVDLRRGSPTFLQWHGERLSADSHRSLVIPEGFAHGFQTLEEGCEMLYFHTAAYRPDAEGGLHPREPRVAVRWPLLVTELSPRDDSRPLLDGNYTGVSL